MTSIRYLPILLASVTALAAGFDVGHAGERAQNSNPPALPGVKANGSAVKPAPPEAEPAEPVPGTPRHFKVGNWDIRISGSISYEIGTGRIPNR